MLHSTVDEVLHLAVHVLFLALGNAGFILAALGAACEISAGGVKLTARRFALAVILDALFRRVAHLDVSPDDRR